MTELIRRAYLRAVRTGAPVYGWSTYARLVLDSAPPDTGIGACVIALPTGRIERHTYDASYQLEDGSYGLWRMVGTATVDRHGSVIAAEEIDR